MSTTIICGTNRSGSLSMQVASCYHHMLEEGGCEAELVNLQDLPSEIAFRELYGGRTRAFEPFQSLVDRTQLFVFVVPEYNGSLPGILKLFIDACDYPDSFRDKWAALVGLSAGDRGNKVGLAHLKDILSYLGSEVEDELIYIGQIRKLLNPQGELKLRELRRILQPQVDTVLEQTVALS